MAAVRVWPQARDHVFSVEKLQFRVLFAPVLNGCVVENLQHL